MPKFWTRLVDSLPRESKNLMWRVPLVFTVLLLALVIFLPFRDTPFAIRVVRDTYDEMGRRDKEAREVVSTEVTNRWVWLTSPFHYEDEREITAKKLAPVAGREVRERTVEVVSLGLNLGLDLRGGTELLYRILRDPKSPTAASAEEIKAVVQRRIDAYGLSECRIQAQGTDRLLVQLPGQATVALETVKSVIQNIGHLEFRIVAPKNSKTHEEWQTKGTAPPGWTEYPLRSLKEDKYVEEKILVKDQVEMTGVYISGTRVITAGGGRSLGPSVGLSFTPRGEREFARITGDNVGERLAIILNTQRSGDEIVEKGSCYSAPVIRTKIYGDAVIEGDFTEKEAEALCTVLRAGSLPAPLRLEHETTVGASLGSALINKGVVASVIGAAAVILFMTTYYLLCGLIADFTVALNVLLLVSVMILFKGTLTLPGIAALALTVGMAVDANVLIFERIREEAAGATDKPLRLAVRDGFGRAFWTIFDSNLTTILTALILYWVGTGPIQGFGLTLTIGLIINMMSAVFVGRVVFDILLWRRWVTRLPMLQFFRRPHIAFMSYRYRAMALSALLIAGGMAVFISRGSENWDIDFRGGTMLHAVFREPQDAEDIVRRLQRVGPEFAQCEVQTLASSAGEQRIGFVGRRSREFEIRVPTLSEVAIPNITSNLVTSPGSLEATLTLAAAMKPDEFREKTKGAGAAEPVGQPDADGAHAAYKIAAPTFDAKQVRADLEKALGAPLESFQVTRTTVNYPTDADVEIDRPIRATDVERQLKAMDPYVRVEPKGDAEGEGQYKKFLVKTTLEDPSAVRLRIERAFAALSLKAEVLATFKDVLAPIGIETLAEKDGRTTLALNLVEPIAPALLAEKLAAWELDATAKPQPEGAAGPVNRFEIALPTAKADDLGRRIAEDPQTFILSDPIPRVAKVGPAVARELLAWAIVGVLASCVMIVAYVWLRFERIKFGVAGVAALVHDVLITMGFLALLGCKFNITIIAALLTIVGYSVNDTIVVFDRIRENLRKERKRDVDSDVINTSVNQTLTRTIITAFTTFLAVLALFFFAGGVIQDFALAMLIGIITGTYSSIFIASPILVLHQEQVEKRLGRARAATT